MLILDFDGTLTNVEQEAVPFLEAYLKDLAALCGMSLEEVQIHAADHVEKLAIDPSLNVWRYGGEIMAPASVDPYLRMSAVAHKLFQDAGLQEAFRERLCQVLFEHHYGKTRDVLRPGAFELLLSLHRREACAYIVTNSGTDPVRAKLHRTIGENIQKALWWCKRVYGGARKYDPAEKHEVGAIWDGMPESQHFTGFPRPTRIKRPHYRKIIKDLMDKEHVAPENVLVVGDVFEFDLALALAMGCHVGLMVNRYTPLWEVSFLSEHPRARVLNGVDAILPYYNEIQARVA